MNAEILEGFGGSSSRSLDIRDRKWILDGFALIFFKEMHIDTWNLGGKIYFSVV
eukprot:CAMPEP_0114597240 /NCGR_PEP_ID=MMETSP0125-20121206/19476_1 /TAXON_ID=485358 ORGANISM="Aristerostoma sp., Strain ATCC 50986" /NCGR_SAMPLE_ID=MMETSP0125 /ASSEMBLY_ACC=CAM_ASM_000245 /LENGTH=53 /DNA_ID=CAMNT_0001801505 /DNA_START=119 /DNA_END=280 /DNA_ORIENTATION=+